MSAIPRSYTTLGQISINDARRRSLAANGLSNSRHTSPQPTQRLNMHGTGLLDAAAHGSPHRNSSPVDYLIIEPYAQNESLIGFGDKRLSDIGAGISNSFFKSTTTDSYLEAGRKILDDCHRLLKQLNLFSHTQRKIPQSSRPDTSIFTYFD